MKIKLLTTSTFFYTKALSLSGEKRHLFIMSATHGYIDNPLNKIHVNYKMQILKLGGVNSPQIEVVPIKEMFLLI